jgi:Peptidase propeptide and YPEB domain
LSLHETGERRGVRRRLTFIVATVAALAILAFGGVAIAGATQGDDDEQPLSGQVAEDAKAAALKEAGGGSVTEMERDVEDGRTYQVEVRKADGTTVDVDLDAAFKVVAVDSDKPGQNEEAQDERDAPGENQRDDQDGNEPDDKNEQADQDD